MNWIFCHKDFKSIQKRDISDELNDNIPVSEDPPRDSDHPENDEDDDEYIVDHTTTKLTETTHHLQKYVKI